MNVWIEPTTFGNGKTRNHKKNPLNANRLTNDFGAQNWINKPLRADLGYLRLHHETMQANWHQYIECMIMRFGMLNNNLSLMGIR